MIVLCFSVIIANKTQFIIVAGIQLIVHKCANSSIGKLNIRKYADASDNLTFKFATCK